MKIKLRKITAALTALCISAAMIASVTACGRSDVSGDGHDSGGKEGKAFDVTVDYSAPDFSPTAIPDPVLSENGDKITVIDSLNREVEIPA